MVVLERMDEPPFYLNLSVNGRRVMYRIEQLAEHLAKNPNLISELEKELSVLSVRDFRVNVVAPACVRDALLGLDIDAFPCKDRGVRSLLVECLYAALEEAKNKLDEGKE
jgi:hypothetical protein